MANVAHSTLTGANLHEPKGVATALSGQVYTADGAGSGTWSTPAAVSGTIQVGTVLDYAGSSAPSGYLFCFGQAISRTTYSALFAVISTTYGIGDASTTFNLPDCRGRSAAGKDDMGGTSANRLTNQTGGLNGDTLGATGGAETATVSQAQLPNVNFTGTAATGGPSSLSSSARTFANFVHSGSVATDTNRIQLGYDSGNTTTYSNFSNTDHTHTVSVASGGSGTGHNNVQPTIIFNKIIYTSV